MKKPIRQYSKLYSELINDSKLKKHNSAVLKVIMVNALLEEIEDFMNYIPLDDMEVDYGN